MIKNWWKYSVLRFYVLNTCWNYKFWLNAKKIYELIPQTNYTNRLVENEIPGSKKRFKGYMYKGRIYLDNPGIPNIERDVWNVWKDKKIIQ